MSLISQQTFKRVFNNPVRLMTQALESSFGDLILK